MTNGFTPTQQRMLNVLADGQAHTREELHACLEDELSAKNAIKNHITAIRKRIQPVGQDVICEWRDRKYQYRQIRLISMGDK